MRAALEGFMLDPACARRGTGETSRAVLTAPGRAGARGPRGGGHFPSEPLYAPYNRAPRFPCRTITRQQHRIKI